MKPYVTLVEHHKGSNNKTHDTTDIKYNAIDHTTESDLRIDQSDKTQQTLQQSISLKNKLLGIMCCAVAIVCWVSLAHVVKYLQSGDGNDEFDKPFFLMYFSVAAYILLFIPWKIMRMRDNAQKHVIIDTQKNLITKSCFKMFKMLLFPSVILAFLLLFVQYLWARSLQQTMVSVNTAIFQSGIAITYILSVIFLKIKLSVQKVFGVTICILGVISISFGAYSEDMDNEGVTYNSLEGLIQVLLSTFLNSLVMVGVDFVSNKFFDQNNQTQDLFYLQGLMGLNILVIYWPFFIIFDALNVESLELPQTKNVWLRVILTVALNFVFLVSYFAAIVLTNAVFVTAALLFVLPVGYFSDIILNDYISNIWAYLGTFFIVIGFVLMELPVWIRIQRILKVKT
eukprot:154245_1